MAFLMQNRGAVRGAVGAFRAWVPTGKSKNLRNFNFEKSEFSDLPTGKRGLLTGYVRANRRAKRDFPKIITYYYIYINIYFCAITHTTAPLFVNTLRYNYKKGIFTYIYAERFKVYEKGCGNVCSKNREVA